jgi:hypothetical protein
MADPLPQVAPPTLLALIRSLIVAWTDMANKWAALADTLSGCVVEIEADADKATDAIKALKIHLL